ncbi:MAG TPA: hypothetical protein VJX74_03320, partial [Blastocatellia bacterium]|nr:hypothetical protein [Blastocatellia bacterium]
MQAMKEQQTPIPKALLTTAEFTINADLRRAIESQEEYSGQIEDLIKEVMRWQFEVDKTTLGFVASRKIRTLMEKFDESPEDSSPLEIIEALLKALEPLALPYNLWKAQNLLFFMGKGLSPAMRTLAEGGDESAKIWIARFDSLSNYLKIGSD